MTPRGVAPAGNTDALAPVLRALLDAVAQPVLVLSGRDTVNLVYANSAFFKATRLARKKLTAGSLAAWLAPDAERRLLEAMKRAWRQDQPVHVELDLFNMPADLRQLKHDGRRYCVATLVSQPQAQDLDQSNSELKRLTAQLMAAMELEGMAAWTWQAGTDWVHTDFRGSRATVLLHAGSLKEFMDRLPEADRQRVRGAMEEAMRSDGVSRLEICVDAAEGGRRWFSMAARRFLDSGGSPAGLVGVTRDVTARKDAYRKLAESEAQLWAILEAEPECVTVADREGIVRLVNPAGLDMFQADDAESVQGKAAVNFIVPESRNAFRSLYERVMAGETGMLEMEIQGLKGGRRHVENHAAPLRDNHGEVAAALMVVRDVTERHLLAAEIIEASNREQRRIGHDLHDGLGQELTGIALLLTGLQSRLERPVAELERELADIRGLVNDAIRSTRSLANGLSPVAVEHGGLGVALRSLVGRARARSGLSMRFSSRGWQDDGVDPDVALHLYRIAQESLTNAMRHAGARHVTTTLSMAGPGVTLRITDDGKGIDAAPPPAAGLGLKIMGYRARMIGARLDIARHRGGGTVVTVFRPSLPARRRRRDDER